MGPGETVFVEVWNTSATNGYAFLENISTGKYAEYNLTAPSGTTLQGTSAEWVVERPEVNGALARLTNYVAMRLRLPTLAATIIRWFIILEQIIRRPDRR